MKVDSYPLNRFAVAPMLAWTDKHCRFFHRQLTKKALLYSEMLTVDAVIDGNQMEPLSETESPVALQLSGSDSGKLAEAAHIGMGLGYDEINLNVGCPSKRAQDGAFGACLMLKPDTIARAIAAMKRAVSIPVTVKCRIGVDEQDSEKALDTFGEYALQEGADAIWVHARKALLRDIEPKKNREIPPLDYERVYRFKQKNTNAFVGINGGICSLEEAVNHLEHVDGVMMGRAAYHKPCLLSSVDHRIYGHRAEKLNYAMLIDTMAAYIDAYLCNGGRVSHVTRHMIGLFHGFNGVRRWRHILSTEAMAQDATSAVLYKAFLAVFAQYL